MMGVAAGCGTEQAETETEETNEVKVYPEHIDAFVDTANFGEPPEIIYTTPASENGLEGELYKIEGEVTESEVTEGEEGMSIGSFTVKTDVGEVSVIDPSLLLSESGVEYGGFTDEILQKYFAVPKVGEKVCVYAEYAGYSDVLQAPACYYGGQKYIEKVVTSMLMDNGYADDSEDAEKHHRHPPQGQPLPPLRPHRPGRPRQLPAGAGGDDPAAAELPVHRALGAVQRGLGAVRREADHASCPQARPHAPHRPRQRLARPGRERRQEPARVL